MFSTFKDESEYNKKSHSNQGGHIMRGGMVRNFRHILPPNNEAGHIKELYCECMPFIDPDDVSTVIHSPIMED